MKSAARNILRLSVVGLCFALGACARSGPVPGGATGSKAEKARKEAEALALSGVNGGATSQAKEMPELAAKRDRSIFGGWVAFEDSKRIAVGPPKPVPPKGGTPPSPPEPPVVKGPPAPKSPPHPGGPPLVIRERVVSIVAYSTEAEAEEDALTQAREIIEKKLSELDPPVRHKVSVNEVRTEFLRKDSRTARKPDPEEAELLVREGISGNLVYVEYDVEVTAEQVRELRAQERVGAGVRIIGALMAVALAGFMFLRADEWTRGYLTSWLALGAAILAGGAAAALIFV
ncbi:hypothetical protein J8F10_22725 [Gemmata sp. G18]|uniref:Uncharacterized protein n=1 Tax=Gemmata palustris TaxID=2822762 RepID=A0ABS5BYV6_9BACT|nr:hypothetical protein [Gemmata palustris]MBP3958078.1 hypothetical protein [Gemmata palustris]